MSLRIAVIVLSVVCSVNVAFFSLYVVPRLSQSGVALCALRADLERRVDTSTQFLVDHPRGIAGIPAKTIRDGIKNQQRTIDALSALKCSK